MHYAEFAEDEVISSMTLMHDIVLTLFAKSCSLWHSARQSRNMKQTSGKSSDRKSGSRPK